MHGAVGFVANGTVDTWTEPRFLAADTYEHVAYATPFLQTTLHALIKRRSPGINFASVTANVDWSIWAVLGACIVFVVSISIANPSGNTLWDHIHSMMPGSNSKAIPNDRGATTKIVIIVWGLLIFTGFTIYQAMLLNSLMTETPATQLTYDQLADMILADELRVVLKFDSSVLHRENSSRLAKLQHAFKTMPFRQISDERDVLDAVLHDRGVYLQRPSRIYPLFRDVPSSMCAEFEVVTFGDDAVMLWLGMILPKGKRELMEAVNVIVAERYAYLDKVDEAYERTLACPNLRAAVSTERQIKYKDITLSSISPVFTVTVVALVCAAFIFCAEVVSVKFVSRGFVDKDASEIRAVSPLCFGQAELEKLDPMELELIRDRINYILR